MRASILTLLLIFASVIPAFAKSTSIHMSGSSVVGIIMKNVVNEYKKKKNTQIQIVFSTADAKTALDNLVSGKTRVAMFSRSLTSEEVNGYPKEKFHSITIARDAIMPVVSFEIFMNGVHSLSYEDLTKVYGGEITNWSDLGGPKQEIYAIDLQDENGTHDVFMQTIFDDVTSLTTGVKKICSSDEEVQIEVSSSSRALAYLSSAWTQKRVRGIGIRTQNGVIYPTPENILSDEYPLSRNLVLVTNEKPAGELKNLLNFLMGQDGQRVVQNLKFVPAIRY